MIFNNDSKSAKPFLRVVSIILINTFLLSGITFAEPQAKIPDPAIKQVITNPDNIVIPREFGLVKSKFNSSSDKLIIHIQDAHCNYEAQSNIARMLETLIKNDSLKLVSVEGADGVIDTSWFKAFPDDAVRKEVADYFMKKGEITGPEFLSITTDYPIKLFGAETRAYYLQNLNAFTSSYPLKADTDKYFNTIKTALNKLKDFIYSDELKLIDAKDAEYESKKLQFNEYVRFLQSEAEKNRINLREYENFFKLVNVLIYEKKIDFNVTDKERSELIDEITKKVSKEAVTQLVAQSIAFKLGKISSTEYYNYLKSLANANSIDLAKNYPNLYNYIIYNSVYSRIENEKLFNDITAVESAIKEKLFKNEDQRVLEKLSRHIDTLIGLVNIKLLNRDFDYYKNHKEEFGMDVFADFIHKKASRFGLSMVIEPPLDAVTKSIAKLEDFYAIAIRRDKALVDNTLSEMKRADQRIAVLVTGGFHSEGIAKLLEKEGVSYMVVCPSITKDVATPYIQVLTNQRTSFEDIVMGAAEPVPAKQGMLAPASIAWAVGLSEQEVLEAGGKTGLADRVSVDMTKWMELSFSKWMERAFRYAGDNLHRMAQQESVMRDAYVMALNYRLAALVDGEIITPQRGEEIRQRIILSPAFAPEFSKAFVVMQTEAARKELISNAARQTKPGSSDMEAGKAPKINPDIYKGMDIRGIADVDLAGDVSLILGKSFAAFIDQAEAGKTGPIVVGMDPRASSGRIKSDFIKGVLDSGIDVIDLTCGGKYYIPTPVIYWAMRKYGGRGGCNVTASHLPGEYNGLKFARATGLDTLTSKEIQRVRAIAEQGSFLTPKAPGRIIEINPLDEYKKWMVEKMRSAVGSQMPLKGLKFSIDYGNGTTSFIGDVFEELGAAIVHVNREPLPKPVHVADPSKKENLKDLIAAVIQNGSDLGIAYDSDGDRVGFVDNKGNVITGNDLLAILALGVVAEHPGSTVVVNTKASYAVPSFIKEKGGVCIFGPTGYAHIRKVMKELNSKAADPSAYTCHFGGEESGHVLFADNDYFDDGMYTTVKLLAILAKEKARSSDLVGNISHYYTKEEVRLALPIKNNDIAAANERKKEIVAKLIPDLKRSIESTMGQAIGAATLEEINIDGPKMYLRDKSGNMLGWILIRVSENEPVITCNIEAIQPAGRYSSIYEYLLNQVVPLMAAYSELDIKKLKQYQADVRKEMLAPLITKGDRPSLDRAITEESDATGRPAYAVSVGIAGRDRDPANDDEWFMAHPTRGPPAVDVLYVGGGGEGATTFTQAIVDSVKNRRPFMRFSEYKQLAKRMLGRLIGAINDGVYDDGGDTAKIRTELHDSGMWPAQVTTLCGDIASVIAYSTGDEAKIFFLGDDFRMTAVINVNTADEDTLRYICDEPTAKNILAARAAKGKEGFTNIDELKPVMAKTDDKLFGRVKAGLKLSGDSKVSVVDFVKDRIRKTQDKIDTGVFKRPADWVFFVNNMLTLARIADDNLAKTHDITLIGSKWQNLMDLAIKIEAGYIKRGSFVFDDSREAAVNKLYEILGIAAGYAKVVSKDDATMVAILEAAALKVPAADGKGEVGYLIAPQGKNFRIQNVEVEISGDIMATAVTEKDSVSIAPNESRSFKESGRDIVFSNRAGELFISIGGKDMKVYEPKEPGRTVVSIDNVDRLLDLAADWNDINLGGLKLSMKSRMVEEQTFITDEVLASRVQKLTFKIARRDASGRYEYEKNPDGSDKRDKSGMRKVRIFDTINAGNMPEVDPLVREMVQNTKKAFVYGEGGMITSLLPNLLVKGLVPAIHDRIRTGGVRGIFYPKLTEDFETKGLSVREQIEVLDRSIEEFTGVKNGFSGMITDIILPQIPDEIRERADIFYEEAWKEFEKHKDAIARRTDKISKYYPMGLQMVTDDDIAYLKAKGIKIHYTANFDINSKKKLVWNKRELYKMVEMISSRASMVAMVKDEGERRRAEGNVGMGETLESPFKGELLWPRSDWDEIFTAISQGLPDTDLVTVVFNKDKRYERVFRLRVPRDLKGRDRDMLVQYMATYLYNRIAVFGARSIDIYSPASWLYDELIKKFEEEKYAKIKDFLAIYNGAPLTIEYRGAEGYYGAATSETGGEVINRRDARRGVSIGIDLKDDSVGVILLQNGKVRKTKYLGWNPGEINDPDILIAKIAGYIEAIVKEAKDLKDYDSIGISWPAAIVNNRIIGRAGRIVAGFDNDGHRMGEAEFGEKVGRLADHLAKRLGKPVVVVNNGQAVAYKKIVESSRYGKRTLFLGLGEGVSVSYADNNRVVDILGELGNMVIDMNIDAPRHSYTGVRGALQQYLSRAGFLRLGKTLLVGDMPPGEVRNGLGMIYEEVSKRYEARLKELGTSVSELLPKTVENMNSAERELHDQIIKDISRQFAARVARLHSIYSNMWTVLLPSSLSSLQPNGDLGSAGELRAVVIRKIADETRKIIHEYSDKRMDVILEDDLSFDDIQRQWLGGNPQANLILDNVAKYLAEALAELRQYIEIENVVIHGDIVPAEIRTYVRNKANEILKRDYGIRDLRVTTLSENTPERRFIGAKGAAYAASMRRDSRSRLQELEGQMDEAARTLGLKQETAERALIASVDKTKLLNDIAESVGIKKEKALENMVKAGMAVLNKAEKEGYELSPNFFGVQNIKKLVALQVASSDNPALVDLTELRIERIILNSVSVTELFTALSFGGKIAVTVEALETRGVFPTLTATWRLAQSLRAPAKSTAPLPKEALVSPEAAAFYAEKGVTAEFSIPADAAVGPEALEAIKNYQEAVARDMARGSYNYRGAGTRQTIEQFYADYFANEWRGKILSFIATRFSATQPLKAIITNGIGANDQFMWSLVNMYNKNRPANAPVWYHVTTARGFAEIMKRDGIKGENTLFIDISRSGATWEGIEVAMRSLALGFNNRIAVANGGALVKIAQAAATSLGKDPLIIGMSPDIGGRNMHRKTSIYYTAQTVAGMFVPEMDSASFAAMNDVFDKANDFASPDKSLPVSAGRFLFGSMRLLGVNHIAFITNTEPLRLAGTEWEQYIMEGSNKEDVISMGAHDLTKEPEYVLTNLAASPAGKKTIGMAILDKASANYAREAARVNSLAKTMPLMVFTIDSGKANLKGGLGVKEQSAFDILWTDMVTVFTTLLRVDANSNPNVKVVREMTARRVSEWRAAEKRYGEDSIGKGTQKLLVGYGTPAAPSISTPDQGSPDQRVAINPKNAAEEGRRMAKKLIREGAIAGRDRLNIFVGAEDLEGLAVELRSKAYQSGLSTESGWIIQTGLFPIWSHKGLEANLAYSANPDSPLLANKTVNIFINARQLGRSNELYDNLFDNAGIMDEKYGAIKGATVHQTNEAMTMPNIKRMAEVSPTILFEFKETDDDIRDMVRNFFSAFIDELAKAPAKERADTAKPAEPKAPAKPGSSDMETKEPSARSAAPDVKGRSDRDTMIYDKYVGTDAVSLGNTVFAIGVDPKRRQKKVVLAYDTGIDPDIDTSHVARAAENYIKKYLPVIVVRGTGTALLDAVERERSSMHAAGLGVTDYAIVTMTGDATLANIGQAGETRMAELGKVINVKNPDGRHIPIIMLFDVALSIAYELDASDILNRLHLLQDPKDPKLTLRDLTSGIIRILPRIRRADMTEAVEAYKAAQQALQSL